MLHGYGQTAHRILVPEVIRYKLEFSQLVQIVDEVQVEQPKGQSTIVDPL